MSSQDLFDNYFINNINNNINSEFYGNNEDINNNNDDTAINTENNTIENESINNISLGTKPIQENFIKKKNAENFCSPLVRISYSKRELYKIEALKYSKAFDYYYSDTLVNEFWKKENQKSFVKKSRNYIHKSRIGKYPEEELCRLLTLYYAIKVNDTVFYTYYDQNYLQYKTSKLLSNMHNINGNYA